MVTETAPIEAPEIVPPTSEADVQAPSDDVSLPSSENQEPEGHAEESPPAAQEQEPESIPSKPSLPTVEDVLEKRRRLDDGDPDVAWTAADQTVWKRHDQSVRDQKALIEKADEQARTIVSKLETMHTTLTEQVQAAVFAEFDDHGAELTRGEAENLKTKIATAFGQFNKEAVRIVLEPMAAEIQQTLRSELVQNFGYTEKDALDAVSRLPLVGPGESLWALGQGIAYQKGKREGPDADSVTLKKADLEKQLKEARAAGERAIRGETVQKPPPGGSGRASVNGVPAISEWQAMTLEQREEMRRKQPDIEYRMAMGQ